jgi:hypothetical protein
VVEIGSDCWHKRNYTMNDLLEAPVADWIRDQVRREVKTQMRRTAMSRTREDSINRLVEVLMPALMHHYRVLLATLNGRTDQKAKWEEQEEGFLDEFRLRLRQRTRAKGLDRRAAAEKAMEEMMDHDKAGRRAEAAKFRKTYNLKKVVPLPQDAHEGFIEKIGAIVGDMFADET